MVQNILTPRQALNKAFLKVKPNRNNIEQFKQNLEKLLDQINEAESEEFHKNIVIKFLQDTYYNSIYYINTKGRKDLVIHNGKKAKDAVGVVVEVKKTINRAEMLRKDNVNTKAFQELVLYYLRERITAKNLELKYLVATNIYEWFIFDANTFEKVFAENKALIKQFNDFEAGRLSGKTTDFFYMEIAGPIIEGIKAHISFTWFDIRDYIKPLRNNNRQDDNKLIVLYKLLSPEHLLKLPFTNDSNTLDKAFYSELLHLIGLSETKQGGKKLIERKPERTRNGASFIENTIIQLDSLDKISRLDKPSQYGKTYQERLFNVALELSITWINRILFLKLLEAQLISYNKGDRSYAFLNTDKIKNFDDLNMLFFNVLAKMPEDRNHDVRHLFAQVPYLNSALFEPTDLEQVTVFISNIRDERMLPLLPSTVLKGINGKKRTGELNTLAYLFEFLNAYDFSIEGAEGIQEDNKALISASILGLIFEKINGYKNGSFFTPGFITMYMCRETIRTAVLRKFKDMKGWKCDDLDQLYNKIEDKKEANAIINSLKICDPAVGSGHFLVSALNEIIAIKRELNILMDRQGRTLRDYDIQVVNDELIITDDDGHLFEYYPNSRESQRVQEILFREKQTIIENCLFGVDINLNSVKICRLRLWIELLKNAYYKPLAQDELASPVCYANSPELRDDFKAVRYLETLPNIDINIKCGNSLISRFTLDSDLRQALMKSKWTIEGYKIAVKTYREAVSKEQKREMERLINNIKTDFRAEIGRNSKEQRRIDKLGQELFQLTGKGRGGTGLILFDPDEHYGKDRKLKKKRKEKIEIEAEINKLTTAIEDIKSNKIYENAFEWRFEFPEVLNDDGDFIGFDVVIGNPPYIRQEMFSAMKPYLSANYKTFSGTADLYIYFVELGLSLLRSSGNFIFILPNKWMRASYGAGLRSKLKEIAIHQIIDFGLLPVFEEATTYPCILHLSTSKAQNIFEATQIDTLDFPSGMDNYIALKKYEVIQSSLQDTGWTLTDSQSQKLMEKIRGAGVP